MVSERRRRFLKLSAAAAAGTIGAQLLPQVILDALAVERFDWKLKKKIGRFAYLVSTVQALRAGLPQVIVSANGRALTGELALLGNGRYYG